MENKLMEQQQQQQRPRLQTEIHTTVAGITHDKKIRIATHKMEL
jgi:hypothetical protein